MMGWDTAFSPGRSPSPSPLSNSSPLRQTLSASPAAEAAEAKRLRRWPWPRRRCHGRGRGRRRTQSFQRPPKEMARTRRVSEQRRMEGGREERKENNGNRSLAKRRRVSILMILVCDWGKGGIFASTFCPLLTWKGLGLVSRQSCLARKTLFVAHQRLTSLTALSAQAFRQ